MQYHSIFAYASRLRNLGNELIVDGLRQRGVEGIVPSHGDIVHVLLHTESCSMIISLIFSKVVIFKTSTM